MRLAIDTFVNPPRRRARGVGGATLFKALGHPLAVEPARALIARLRRAGPVAVYDPHEQLAAFAALYPLAEVELEGVYVQALEDLAERRLGHAPKPVTELARSKARGVLIACFDAEKAAAQIAHLMPAGAEWASFDALRLPDDMLTVPRDYLAPLNFATNFAFLRDGDGEHTVLSTANYWAGYGANAPSLWCRLFGGDGAALADWRQPIEHPGQSIVIDSRAVRARFGLGPFAGSLFLHVIGGAGHEVVKYALDTFGADGRKTSCTHDANAWPADYYAGLPAPAEGERLVLWIQNSHPGPIPKGAVGLSFMGSQEVRTLDAEIPGFGALALDVATLLPEARWPAQLEVRAGRYFVRPRYEIEWGQGRRRIAHANVERTDLAPDPELPKLGRWLGKGFIMPLPVPPVDEFATCALPTPMARAQAELPLAAALYDADGTEVAKRSLGRVPRRACPPIDVDAWLAEEGLSLPSGYGHLELMYDFAEGGAGDGWLHAIGRYKARGNGHQAETSFGAHVFNTALIYGDEPQSYAGRPPGLSTRLFLRLGEEGRDTLLHLIYPASTPWHAKSSTRLLLHDASGELVAEEALAIPCSGSAHWRYSAGFAAAARERAGSGAYIVVRDATCRLFGYHGLLDKDGFSLDHMFGF